MTEQKPNAAGQLNVASEEKILADLLGNLPSEEEITVDVPSKGRFYNLLDPTKPITIRPLTFADEKKLMTNRAGGTEALNKLIEKCVQNVNISELLELDKLYLLMKIREVSYGTDYKASITCPSCGQENKVTFNLSELPVNYLPDDFSNPIEIELPVLKKKIKVRLPRVEDEAYMRNPEIALANLWRFVEEIEGHTQKTIISKVIQKLPLKDAHALMNAMGSSGYGMDTRIRFACSYCSLIETMELPIGADFFTNN
tara:strand:- start:1565 stop:2332 length:768 start_codon:yes stop_codon:yes gene_type:complete